MKFTINGHKMGLANDLEFLFTDANAAAIGAWSSTGLVGATVTHWAALAHLGNLAYQLQTDVPAGAVTFWFRRISNPAFLGSQPLLTMLEDAMTTHDGDGTVGAAIRRAGAVGRRRTGADEMTVSDKDGDVAVLDLSPAGGPYAERAIQ